MQCRFIVPALLAVATFVGVGASAAAPAHDEIIPVLELDGIALPTALRQLSARAHLNVVLDPRLSEPRFEGVSVSIRWHDVTAREALDALLENYGLVLVSVPRPSDRVAR